MSAALALTRSNPFVSLQDAGRSGAMRYGVSQSGPMDWVRYRLALTLAGANGPAFEIGLAGARFKASGTVQLGIAGPGFSAKIVGGDTVPLPARLTLGGGEEIDITPGREGMWAYLAAKGLDTGEPVLGSFATNARTGLGRRSFDAPFPCDEVKPFPPQLFTDLGALDGPIAVLPGPQHHLFVQEELDRFASQPFRLTDQLDRMGYKLSCDPIHAITHDIISDGIVEGSIQVPGNGQPIILCADRQPTGGYPKIGVVAAASRPALTQRRPGAEVRFRWIDAEAAAKARHALAEAAANPKPRQLDQISGETLMAVNLIGGVWADGTTATQ